ncbi:MAG: PfkB family carbohydrate kinase [Elusimicrobiota bacterium]|jgi:sugar/nucleoside kinase (ribokinase family)|nr:PfkB family carbohydrate kinase [Elusimicrobiota bacterium]
MAKAGVLIAGSIAFDDIKTHRASAKGVLGGAASYASIAASYFARPKPVAVVGTDFRAKHIAPFKKCGVDLSAFEIKKGRTFTWAASYDKDFKTATTLSTHLNVFENYTPVLKPQDRRTDAVFLANISPALQMTVLDQLSPRPRLVACDTMNLWIKHNRAELMKLIKRVDVLFVNETEVRRLTGIYNLIKAGRAALGYGPRAVIIKLGPNGAMLATKTALCQMPPFLVEEPVDTTGAGDSFGGGFTGFLAGVKNWADIKNLKRGVAAGTVMASFAIESFSITRLAGLSKKEITARMAQYSAGLKF